MKQAISHPGQTQHSAYRKKRIADDSRKFSAYAKVLFLFLCLLICRSGPAQAYQTQSPGLFDSDEILEIKLTGNIRELVNDRSDDMQYHPIIMSYQTNDSLITFPIKVKTRGHFRRTMGNCLYPPLMLNFQKKETPEHSIFSGQNKIKLVTPCRDDRYVVQEYLVYKLYNLVTEKSFRARLVRVVFEDTVKEKKSDSLFGILLEDDDQMAHRNGADLVNNKLIPEQTNRDEFLKMAVFEYLIGNTDWSVQYAQNIKLISSDTLSPACPVPYDFDHAGIVQAPYAKPAAELELGSTRERRYRGYCMPDLSSFKNTFESFNLLKEDFYNVYEKCPWISDGYKKSTLKFLDDFYKTINNEKAAHFAFMYPCDEHGTGNVVIKGLK